MESERYIYQVSVRRAKALGWNHQPEDVQKLLERILDAASFYDPEVKFVGIEKEGKTAINERILVLLTDGKRVQAVKLARAYFGFSVREAADYVDKVEKEEVDKIEKLLKE